MDELQKAAYGLLTDVWACSHGAPLYHVADQLQRGNTPAAVQNLDYAIDVLTAQVALRAALLAGDVKDIEGMRERTLDDIIDWPNALEKDYQR
jgi:hypothetical protein